MAGIAGNEFEITDKRITCPYNKAHVVPIERMSKHLVTCRKQHSDVELKICPFNATHHVRVEEFHSHIMNCQSKDVAEKAIFIERESNLNTLPAYATKNNNYSNEEECENWDTVSNLPQTTYNPKLEALQKIIFRRVPHELGASGKKRWRKVEEERIRRLQSGESIDDLKFPTADGGVETIAEIFKRYGIETNSKPELLMSETEQSVINKALMRVDLSSKTKTKNKSANASESKLCNNSLNSSPLAANEGKRSKGKKKNLKLTEITEESESIFKSFSKTKPKGVKENVKPSF